MKVILGVLLSIVLAGASEAQPKSDPKAPPPVVVQPLPLGATPRPVALTRVGAQMRDTQKVGTFRSGTICVNSVPVM
jgi:hypothetical protein